MLALIMAAARVVFQTSVGQRRREESEGDKLWTTSWTSDRGFFVRINEGSRLERSIPAKALDSVPGTFERGLMDTSNVAFEGSSDDNRTSIGAERDARAVTLSP